MTTSTAPAAPDIVPAARADVACDHCGLPVPEGLRVDDADRQFCCDGCASVYRMIHGCDLGRYYELRDALNSGKTSTRRPSDSQAATRYQTFDDPKFLASHTRQLTNGLRHVDLRLAGVHCAACVWLVERLPRVCPGVVEARLSLQQCVVRVTWDPDRVALSEMASTLHRLGYPPHPAADSVASGLRLAGERKMLVRLGIAGACAGNAMLLAVALYMGLIDGMAEEFKTFLRWISLGIGAIALAGPGAVFFRGAWAGWRTRTATLDLPIAVALGVGGAAGTVNVITGRGDVYFDSLCVLVFLLLVGRYLQMRQQRRTTDAVTLMQSLTPIGCAVWRGGGWIDLPLEAVEVGDRVRVPSNERLPIDGIVAAGESSLNTALLTGESRPAEVRVGDRVFAGSHNMGATLEIDVHAVGVQTRLARLMEDAAAGVAKKPGVVRMADRIAAAFTVTIIALAAAVFGGWWWASGLEPAINHSVALLIVACPCALGLATPLTLAVGLGVAARRDILVKDAAVFEKLASVTPHKPGVVALDKTGTLTEGLLRVVGWVGDETIQPEVGRAERDARHPVGRALRQAYDPSGPPRFDPVIEDPRGGLTANTHRGVLRIGNERFLHDHHITIDPSWKAQAQPYHDRGATLAWITRGESVVAFAALEDSLRPDTAAAIGKLDAMGWAPAVLSGDLSPAVQSVAGRLGIDPLRVHAQLAPEDKPRLVEQYRSSGQAVLMIGDGINDAAALAAADVGLAVHGGAEAAMAVADAYAARPGLGPVTELVALSRFTVRIIRQNLWVSLSYNAITVGLAVAGLLTPWVAAILMPISSLTVLSLAVSRLSRWKGGA